MAEKQLVEREEDYFDLLYGGMSDLDGKSDDQTDKKNKVNLKSHDDKGQDEKLNETFELYADLSLEEDKSGPSHSEAKTDRLKMVEDKVTDLDLYDDILTEQDTQQKQTLEEKCREYEKAKKLIEELEAENKKLKEDLIKQTSLSENVQKNMSSLLITARGEISRKDREISRLRKRHHGPPSHNYRNPLPQKEGHDQVKDRDKKKALKLREEREEKSRVSAKCLEDDMVQQQNLDRTRDKQNTYVESDNSEWCGSDDKVRPLHSKPEKDVGNYRMRDTPVKNITQKETEKKESTKQRSKTTGKDDKSYRFEDKEKRNASSKQKFETGDSKGTNSKDNYKTHKHKGVEFHPKEQNRRKVDNRIHVIEEQIKDITQRDKAKENDFESKNNHTVATEWNIGGHEVKNADENRDGVTSVNQGKDDSVSHIKKRHGKLDKNKCPESESQRKNKDGRKIGTEIDRIHEDIICEKRIVKDKGELGTKTDSKVNTKVKIQESECKKITDFCENKRSKTIVEKDTDRMDIHVIGEKKQFSVPKVMDLREILKQKRSQTSNKPAPGTTVRIERNSIQIDKEIISRDKVFNKVHSKLGVKDVNEHFKDQNESILSKQRVDNRQENTEHLKDKLFLESIKRNVGEKQCQKSKSESSRTYNCHVPNDRTSVSSSCSIGSEFFNGRDLVTYEDYSLYSKSAIKSPKSMDDFSGHDQFTNSMIKIDGKTSTDEQHSKLPTNENSVYQKVKEKDREIDNEPKSHDLCGKNQIIANSTYKEHLCEQPASAFQSDEMKRKSGSNCGSTSDEVFSEIEPVYTAKKLERRRSSEKKKKNYRRVTSETISSVTSSEESPSVEEFLRNLRQECESKNNDDSQIESDTNDKGENCAAKDDIKVKHPLCSKEGCHIKVNHIHPKPKTCSDLVNTAQAHSSLTSSVSIEEDEIPCSSVDSTKIFSENTECSSLSFSETATDTQTDASTNDPASYIYEKKSSQRGKGQPPDPLTKYNMLTKKPFESHETMLKMRCAESILDIPCIVQDKPVCAKQGEYVKDKFRSKNKMLLNEQNESEKNQGETENKVNESEKNQSKTENKINSPIENKNTSTTGILTVNEKNQNKEKDIGLKLIDSTKEKTEDTSSSSEDESSSSDDESESDTNSEFNSSSTTDSSSNSDESSDERKTVKSFETVKMRDTHSTINCVDSIPMKLSVENSAEHEKSNSVGRIQNKRKNPGSETFRESARHDSTHQIEFNHSVEKKMATLEDRKMSGNMLKDPHSAQPNRGCDKDSVAVYKANDISTVLDKIVSEKASPEKTEELERKSFLLQSLLCGIDMVVQQKREDEKYLSKKTIVRNKSQDHSGKGTADISNITQTSVNKSRDKKETAGNICGIVQNDIRAGLKFVEKEQALEKTNTDTVKIDSAKVENSIEDKLDNRTLNTATTVTYQNETVHEYDGPGKAYQINGNKDTCDHKEVYNSAMDDENNFKQVVNDLDTSTVEKNIFGSTLSLSSDDSSPGSESDSGSSSGSDSQNDSSSYSSGSESSDDESDTEDKTLSESLKLPRDQRFSKTVTRKDGQANTDKTQETVSPISSKTKACPTGSEESLMSQSMERHDGHIQNKSLVSITNASSNSLMVPASSDRSDSGVALKVCNNPYMIQDELPKFMCDDMELKQTETKTALTHSPRILTVPNRNMVVRDTEESIKKTVQQTSQKEGECGSTSNFCQQERSTTGHNIPNLKTGENFDNKGKNTNEITKETQCENSKMQRACSRKLSNNTVKKDIAADERSVNKKKLTVKERSLHNERQENNCGQTESTVIKSSDSRVVPRLTGTGNPKEMRKSDVKDKKKVHVPTSTTVVKNQSKCSQMASKGDQSVSGSILRLVSKSSDSLKEKGKKPKSQLASPKKMPNKTQPRDSVSNKQKTTTSGIAKKAKLTFEHKALPEYKDPAKELTESLVKLTAYHDRVKEIEKRRKDQEKKCKKPKKLKTPPSTYLERKPVISSDTEDYDIDEVNIEGNSISSQEISSVENFTTFISVSPVRDGESEEKGEYHFAYREEDPKNLKKDNLKTKEVPKSFESVLVDLENYQLVNANRKTKSKGRKSDERDPIKHDTKNKQEITPKLSLKINANQTSKTKAKIDANTSVAVECSLTRKSTKTKLFAENVQEGQQSQMHSKGNIKKTEYTQNKDSEHLNIDRSAVSKLDKNGVDVNNVTVDDNGAVVYCSSSEDSYSDCDSSDSETDKSVSMVKAIFGSSDSSAEKEKKHTNSADKGTTKNREKKERKKMETEVIPNLDDKLIKLYSSRRKQSDCNPVSKSTDVITGKLSEENSNECESSVLKSLSPKENARKEKNQDKVNTVTAKINENTKTSKAIASESVKTVKAKTNGSESITPNDGVINVKAKTDESMKTSNAKRNGNANSVKDQTIEIVKSVKAQVNESLHTVKAKTNDKVNSEKTKTNGNGKTLKAKPNEGVNAVKAKTNESVNTVKAQIMENVNTMKAKTNDRTNSVKAKTNGTVNTKAISNKSAKFMKAKASECVVTLKGKTNESVNVVKANTDETVDSVRANTDSMRANRNETLHTAKYKTNESVNTLKVTELNKDSASSGNTKEKSVTDFILEDTDVLDVIDYEDDLSLGLDENELEIPDTLNDADAPTVGFLQNEQTCEGHSTLLEDGEVSGDCETETLKRNDNLSEKSSRIIAIPKKDDGRPGLSLESAKPFSPIKFPSPANSPSTPDRKARDDCYESANTQCTNPRGTLSKRKRSLSDSNSDENSTPVRKASSRDYRHRSRSPKVKRHRPRSEKGHTSRRSPSPRRARKSGRSRSISRSRNKKSRSRSVSDENSESRYRAHKKRPPYKRIGRKRSLSEHSSSDEESASRRSCSYRSSKDRLSRRRKSDLLNKYDSPHSERKRYSRNISRKGSDSDEGHSYDKNSNNHRMSDKKSKVGRFLKIHDDSSPYRERYSEKDRSSHKRRYLSSSDDEYVLVKKTELKRRRSERSKTPQLPESNNLTENKDSATLKESSRRKNSSEKENVTSPYCKTKGDSGRKIFQHRVL